MSIKSSWRTLWVGLYSGGAALPEPQEASFGLPGDDPSRKTRKRENTNSISIRLGRLKHRRRGATPFVRASRCHPGTGAGCSHWWSRSAGMSRDRRACTCPTACWTIRRPPVWLCQRAQRAPRLPDGQIHLCHPMVEVAGVELPPIDRRQRGGRPRQHHAVGRVVRLVETAAGRARVSGRAGRAGARPRAAAPGW